MSYTVKILSSKDFDKLPFSKASDPDALGVADPKTMTAYIRDTGYNDVTKMVISHELDELMSKDTPPGHEGPDGERYFLGSLFGALGSGLSNLGSGLWSGVSALGRGIGNVGSSLWGGLKGIGGGIMDMFKGLGGSGAGSTASAAAAPTAAGSGTSLAGMGWQPYTSMASNAGSAGATGAAGRLGGMVAENAATSGSTLGNFGNMLKNPYYGMGGNTNIGSFGGGNVPMSAFNGGSTTGYPSWFNGGANSSVIDMFSPYQASNSYLSPDAIASGGKSGGGGFLSGMKDWLTGSDGGTKTGTAGSGKGGSDPNWLQKQLLGGGISYLGDLLTKKTDAPDYAGVKEDLQNQIDSSRGPGSGWDLGFGEAKRTIEAPLDEVPEEVYASSDRVIDEELADNLNNLANTFKSLNPNADIEGNSAYAEQAARMKRDAAQAKMDNRAKLQYAHTQEQMGRRLDTMKELLELDDAQVNQYMKLAQLDVMQLSTQFGIDVQEAMEFKQLFSDVGQGVMSGYYDNKAAA